MRSRRERKRKNEREKELQYYRKVEAERVKWEDQIGGAIGESQ